MALHAPSLILWGYSIDVTNQNVDFKSQSGGPVLTATVPFGSYSLTDLMTAIGTAMGAADPNGNTYTVTANRTIAGGLQNRITVSTSGTFLSLLFASGPNFQSSIASEIGFLPNDFTGATTYTGTITTGLTLLTQMPGYNWVPPTRKQKVFGNVNVSASGLKESIVFALQQFLSIDFRYEPKTVVDTTWLSFFQWAIQQQPFEITPEYNNPTVFYPVTIEMTPEGGTGLEFEMKEMLPEFPDLFQTGKLLMRVIVPAPPALPNGG